MISKSVRINAYARAALALVLGLGLVFSEVCVQLCYRCLHTPRVIYARLVVLQDNTKALVFCPKALHSEDNEKPTLHVLK